MKPADDRQADLFGDARALRAPADNDNARPAEPTSKLRLGRWQDVFSDDYRADALLTDAPYSARTHRGHDSKTESLGAQDPLDGRRALPYACFSPDDVRDFVGFWAPRVRGWFVTITDHVLAPVWEAALEASGRYVFSPLAYLAPGSRVRVAGDGPAQWSTWIIAARPREKRFLRWGALPGGYVLPPGQQDRRDGGSIVGAKELWIMRALVRDYSRAGDVVVDPCAGSGTTLVAALIEGRSADGAEVDPETYELAAARLRRGYTPTLF